MLGRRCDPGCESWPDSDRYNVCPVCGEKTTRYSNLEPLTQKEANEREFELFYGRWDDDRDPSRLEGNASDARGPFVVVPAHLALPPGPSG